MEGNFVELRDGTYYSIALFVSTLNLSMCAYACAYIEVSPQRPIDDELSWALEHQPERRHVLPFSILLYVI